MSQDAAKRAAGLAGAALVDDGMRLGLGTGSTTAEALRAIGERIRSEGLRVTGVPTSTAAERLAREHGIPLTTLDDVDELDLALDGADEVVQAPDGAIHLIKGRGAAHTRERVVAAAARRFVVLADESKLVGTLGQKMPVPVEIVPMALAPVRRALEGMGAGVQVREGGGKDGPVVSDQGLWLIDARFTSIDDPAALALRIKSIPGVLDHGLFVDMAAEVLIGLERGDVRRLQRGGSA